METIIRRQQYCLEKLSRWFFSLSLSRFWHTGTNCAPNKICIFDRPTDPSELLCIESGMNDECDRYRKTNGIVAHTDGNTNKWNFTSMNYWIFGKMVVAHALQSTARKREQQGKKLTTGRERTNDCHWLHLIPSTNGYYMAFTNHKLWTQLTRSLTHSQRQRAEKNTSSNYYK